MYLRGGLRGTQETPLRTGLLKGLIQGLNPLGGKGHLNCSPNSPTPREVLEGEEGQPDEAERVGRGQKGNDREGKREREDVCLC